MLAVGTSTAIATSVSAEENAPVAVSLTGEKVWGDYNYTVLADGTVEITDYIGSDTDLVIPSEIDGKKVTALGNYAFSSCESLTNVTISDSVITIGDNAFDGCYILTIYGYSGSYAETYANENSIPFVDINERKATLLSKVGNISVSGAFDNGTTLNVEEISIKNAIIAYDISLKDENGEIVQPIGEITVSIPCNKKDCKVVWVKDDGTQVDMNAEYIDGCYVFKTNHLSIYAIISNGLLGDTNGDGEVNIADALMISRYDAGLVTLDDAQLSVSDVNKDGEVNIADALMISRYDAGMITSI